MQTVNSYHPMDKIKDKLKDILNVVPSGSQVYYIDYPVYGNGGDMLIMKGTEKFFSDNRIKVLKRFSALDFPEGHHIPQECIIILNGGGNFGDLYTLHQRLREHIVNNYRSHRIVVLPQTIYYKDEKEYDKTAIIFNQHKDLHIYVRDTECYELAKKKFNSCHVYLSPDMAHQLWPISHQKLTQRDTLYFLRTDIEKGSEQQELIDTERENCRDWSSLFTSTDKKIIKSFSKMYLAKRKIGIKLPFDIGWYKYTDYLIKKAVGLFERYRVIETSRLHGHILSCLMDKQNILIDNSYGKNSSYYYTWTHQCKNTKLYLTDRV